MPKLNKKERCENSECRYQKRVLQQLSKGRLSKGKVVQGTVFQVDGCPRRLLSKETIVQGRLLSKVTAVQGDFCPRRQVHALLSKDSVQLGLGFKLNIKIGLHTTTTQILYVDLSKAKKLISLPLPTVGSKLNPIPR